MNTLIKTLFLLGITLGMYSCGTPAKYHYFQDVTEGQLLQMAQQQKIKFKPQDELNIVVETKDPSLSRAFNKAIISELDTENMNGINQLMYYTIDNEGNVELPYLGIIHIGGMDRHEAELYIQGMLRDKSLINDAIVTIYTRNWEFNILGEVANPGKHAITKEYFTILDAIGTAGDLTLYAKRDGIIVIREEENGQKAYKLDMTSVQSLCESPAFYIQQNDVIYVSPTNMRARQSTTNGNQTTSYSFWLSIISVLTTISVLVFK